MRTTLNIGDDVYRAARSLAAAKGIGLGEALTELARRGLRQARDYQKKEEGLPGFSVSEEAKPFGLEDVGLEESEDSADSAAGPRDDPA